MVRTEFDRLVEISTALRDEYVEEDARWEGSPFAWIRQRPSRQRGKIGEQLVAKWCKVKGLDVVLPGDSEADRVIEGRRVEIKFSMLWRNGTYRFQQFRDQDYEAAICLGVSPFDAHCWVIPKKALYEHVIGKTPQHGGRTGRDTFWLPVDPLRPPEWLRPYGGSLPAAWRVLRRWSVEGGGRRRRRR